MSLFKFGFTSPASKEGAKKIKKDSGKTDVCVRRSMPRSTKKTRTLLIPHVVKRIMF